MENNNIMYFEGPEKKLEVDFLYSSSLSLEDSGKGLLSISREKWENLLSLAHCEIVSAMENEWCKAYVLSESSLFVYPTKILLKTCGTTSILAALEALFEIGHSVGLRRSFVSYSRKNFNFPEGQHYPHRSFKEEVEYLDQHLDNGFGVVLGSPNSGQWHQYVADYTNNSFPWHPKANPTSGKGEMTLEICMHDLSPEKMKMFYKKKGRTVEDVTRLSGIDKILPGTAIDAFQFDPCGYSMNGLLDRFYSTIHITPEAHCSYASYETNIDFTSLKQKLGKTPEELVKDVLACFQPGRFSVMIFKDNELKQADMCFELFSNGSGVDEFGVANDKKEEVMMKAHCSFEFENPYTVSYSAFVVNSNDNAM